MPSRRSRTRQRPRRSLRPALLGWAVAALLAATVAGVLGATAQPPQAFAAGQARGGITLDELALRTPDGDPVPLAADGGVTAVFFGFTRCPDYCPGVLQRWRQVRAALGAEADALRVLFVTLDPEHDTAEVLAGYLGYFDDAFVGLSGTEAELADAASRLGAVYRDAAGDGAVLDHTSLSYLFDGHGRLRVAVRDDAPTEAMLHDVRTLLGAGGGAR